MRKVGREEEEEDKEKGEKYVKKEREREPLAGSWR